MMAFAPLLAVHLLSISSGQLSKEQQEQYKEAMKYKNNPKSVPSAKDNPYLENGKAPRTCEDKCEIIEKSMGAQCDSLGKKKPAGVKPCKDNSKNTVELCQASCRDKGKIDKDYMMKHMKKPHAPPGREGARPSSGDAPSGDDASGGGE